MCPSDPFSDFVDGDKTVIRPKPGGRRKSTQPSSVQYPDTGFRDGDLQSADLGNSNPYIAGSFSILSLTSKLRTLPLFNDINRLHQNLVSEITEFEKQILQRGVSQDHAGMAKMFLCSLIDETVLNTPWGHQSDWKHNNLSSRFFGDMWGGEKFFEALDGLKRQARQNLALLELAYICLSLGFQGKYRYAANGLRELDNEHQELYLLLRQAKGDPERNLSIVWRGCKVSNPLIRYVPLWVLFVVACSLVVLTYAGFLYAITNSSNHVYDKLIAIAEEEEKSEPIPAKEIPLSFARDAAPVDTSTLEFHLPVSDETDRFRKLLAEEIAKNMVTVIEGPIIRISNAFPSGSDEIKKEFHPIFDKIAEEIKNDESRIEVVGHTDNQKIKFSLRFPDNLKLSYARAENAAKLLKAHPSLMSRVNFIGKGYSEPIAKNDTKKNRAINRRIDIYIR